MAKTKLPKFSTPMAALKVAALMIFVISLWFGVSALGLIGEPASYQISGLITITASLIVLIDLMAEKGRKWDMAEILMALVGGLALVSGIGIFLATEINSMLTVYSGLIQISLAVALAIALMRKGVKI